MYYYDIDEYFDEDNEDNMSTMGLNGRYPHKDRRRQEYYNVDCGNVKKYV